MNAHHWEAAGDRQVVGNLSNEARAELFVNGQKTATGPEKPSLRPCQLYPVGV